MICTMADFDIAEADRLLTTTKQARKRLDLDREVPIELLLGSTFSLGLCLGLLTGTANARDLTGWTSSLANQPFTPHSATRTTIVCGSAEPANVQARSGSEALEAI